MIEEKMAIVRNIADDSSFLDDYASTINQLKYKSKTVRDKLSVITCDLVNGDEALSGILDTVFEHNKKYKEFETEMVMKSYMEQCAESNRIY